MLLAAASSNKGNSLNIRSHEAHHHPEKNQITKTNYCEEKASASAFEASLCQNSPRAEQIRCINECITEHWTKHGCFGHQRGILEVSKPAGAQIDLSVKALLNVSL